MSSGRPTSTLVLTEVRIFSFLSENPFIEVPKDSIYRRDYVEYPIDAGSLNPNDPNLRGTHYSLGNDKDQAQYTSINKSDYLPPPSHLESAKLNDEKKNDLRTHHFLLGNQSSLISP